MTNTHTPEELTCNFREIVPAIQQTIQVMEEISNQLDECALLDKPNEDEEVQALCAMYAGLLMSYERLKIIYLTLNN